MNRLYKLIILIGILSMALLTACGEKSSEEIEKGPEPEPPVVSEELIGTGKTIVIDPGHQGKGNPEREPIAPGVIEMKAKVASGTTGRTTGIPEYVLTLEVSLKLRDALIAEGYEVLMTRESHDVNISNAERAQIANNINADAFIRIHANGSEDSSVNGAMTLCQTPENPHNGHLFEKSYALSENILDCLVDETGAKKQYVWKTDTMSGINWCAVPVTIVEMGYMSNPEEDVKLATAEYQARIVEGIVKGINKYFEEVE